MKKKYLSIISLLLAICCLSMACSCTKEDNNGDTDDKKTTTEVEVADFDYFSYTDMGKTVNLANTLANGVQAYYTTADKDAYAIENQYVKLTHNLTKGNAKYVADLSTASGNRYLMNTMDTFIESSGEFTYAADSEYTAFVNTTKLGYYYYEMNVRDLMYTQSLYAEKTYHVYSNRIYQQFRLLAANTVNNLDAFGFEVKLRGDTVDKIELYDGNKYYTSENDSYDKSKIQYVAFDIKNVGVIGFINSTDGCEFKLIKNAKGNYILTQTYSLTGTELAGNASVIFGNRLYTDETHDFSGVRNANTEELNPLTKDNISVDTSIDKAAFNGYDRLTGRYNFYIAGSGFAEAYANPYKQYKEIITVKNCPDDREVYFYIHSENPLEGAAIMDSKEQILPMGLEVCKNFNHEKEEPIYDPSDSMYGDTIFPYSVEKNKEVTFTVLNVYQNWGDYPIKQLSSISYFISYYHLSTGIRETNCIAPYFSARANRRGFSTAWILPDFRGASCDPKTQADTSGQQRDSVGTLSGVTNGTDLGNYTSSYIRSAGLTYADLDYSYISADRAYKYTYRHVEMPQLDEARTYYTVEIEFLKDTELKPEDFSIIGIDGRNASWSKMAYLDENGTHQEVTDLALKSDGSVGTSKLYKLHSGSSYFTYYDIEAEPAENGNFGLIVRDYDITVGGEKSSLGLALYDSVRSSSLNFGGLTIEKKTAFKTGDKISANIVLLPYGSRHAQKDCQSVLNVYEDSATNPLKVTAKTGTAVADTYMPTVQAYGDMAEFTLSGGTSEKGGSVSYTVKVTGFSKLGKPIIRENETGAWTDLKYSSSLGYDGYSVSYENGKLTYTFVITKNKSDKTIKIAII